MSGGKLKILPKSIWSIDLSKYDVVYTFLAPPPMPKIWTKVKSEMRPGSIYLNNSFAVPAPPNKVVEVDDNRKCVLYRHDIV